LKLIVGISLQRNYRFFYMFVFSTTLICLYVFVFCWVYVFKIRESEHLSIGKAMLKTPVSIALIGYCFLCVWFVGGLSVFHFYLMSTNQVGVREYHFFYLMLQVKLILDPTYFLCRQHMRISDTAMIVVLTHITEVF
jgi:hypothetical protein